MVVLHCCVLQFVALALFALVSAAAATYGGYHDDDDHHGDADHDRHLDYHEYNVPHRHVNDYNNNRRGGYSSSYSGSSRY